MGQPSIAHASIKLLKDIYEAIEADIADEVISFEVGGRLTYCLYTRSSEIFLSVIALLEAEIITTATMLLRPLCENFALLRASIDDENFSARYLKKALEEKISWAEKAIRVGPDQLAIEKNELLDLQQNSEDEFKELHQRLQSPKQLLADSEPLIYFHIFSPASLYLHSNAHSMSMYFNEDNSVVPTEKRDDSGRYKHVTLSAASVFIKTYDQICDKQNRSFRLTDNLNCRLENLAAFYKTAL